MLLYREIFFEKKSISIFYSCMAALVLTPPLILRRKHSPPVGIEMKFSGSLQPHPVSITAGT